MWQGIFSSTPICNVVKLVIVADTMKIKIK